LPVARRVGIWQQAEERCYWFAPLFQNQSGT